MNVDELALEHEHDHSGYVLSDWYDAAFPSYEVYLRVNVLEAQIVQPIEEFVLRLIDADVDSSIEISQLMGLEHRLIEAALETLERLGYLSVTTLANSQPRRELLTITGDGRQLLRTLVINRPVEDKLRVCSDALTGALFRHRRLPTPRDIREEELHQIPALLPDPTPEALDIVQLRRLWAEIRRSLPLQQRVKSRELLNVAGLEKAFIGYRRMRILQFVRQVDGEPLVHVYEGSDRSLPHEVALLRMEQDGRRALRVDHKPKQFPAQLPDPAASLLGEAAHEAAWRKYRELPNLRREIEAREQKLQEELEAVRRREQLLPAEEKQLSIRQIGDLRAELERLQDRVAELSSTTGSSEILSMAEHRPWLFRALAEAKQRVIIVSPWLTPTAVNYELREAIAACLERGVSVWIGYGFGESDRAEERVLQRLNDLRKKTGRHGLFLKRFNDSHAKLVICDERFMITTSFNWLSFAGREDWGNRIEFGTLIRNPSAVQNMLKQLEPLFEATFVVSPAVAGASQPAPHPRQESG